MSPLFINQPCLSKLILLSYINFSNNCAQNVRRAQVQHKRQARISAAQNVRRAQVRVISLKDIHRYDIIVCSGGWLASSLSIVWVTENKHVNINFRDIKRDVKIII
jgi:hypothetical protein